MRFFVIKKYTKVNLRYAWFALAVLSCLNIINYADRSIFNALMVPINAGFKFTDLQLGWLASAFLLVYAIAAYPMARLADKGARKMILVIGVLVWSLATFLTGLSHSYTQLFFSRGILGVGEASYATTLAPLISDYFPASLRSTALGFANVPLGVGTALGYYVAGVSNRKFGWRHAFFYMGIPGLILGICAMFLREPVIGLSEHENGENISSKQTPTFKVLRALFSIKTLWFLWASQIVITFSLGGLLVWIAVLLHRSYGFSVTDAAIQGASAALIGSVLGVSFGGFFADLWNRKAPNGHIWVIIIGCVFSGVFLWFFLHVHQRMEVLFCIGMVAFFQMAINGPVLATMMNVTLPHLRSTCNAVYLFLIHLLGDAASPPVIGLLSNRMGELKGALAFFPWLLLLSAFLAAGALFSYTQDRAKMLKTLKTV